MFGEDFEDFERVQADIMRQAEAEEPSSSEVGDSATIDKSKGKKGKIVAKSSGHKYQFQILLSIGVPRSDIKKFADPMHWLVHFPPIAIVGLNIIILKATLDLYHRHRKIIQHLVAGSTGDESF